VLSTFSYALLSIAQGLFFVCRKSRVEHASPSLPHVVFICTPYRLFPEVFVLCNVIVVKSSIPHKTDHQPPLFLYVLHPKHATPTSRECSQCHLRSSQVTQKGQISRARACRACAFREAHSAHHEAPKDAVKTFVLPTVPQPWNQLFQQTWSAQMLRKRLVSFPKRSRVVS